jgi:uncharacterized OsmC-like protein
VAVLRLVATSLALAATIMFVAACGGGGHSPAEAHLAALANAVCSEVENMGHHDRLKEELAKLRAQLSSDRKLPRVATYLADEQANDRVQAALSKLSYKEYEPAASTLLKESSRLQRKLELDVKALGWMCPGL